MLDPSLSGLSQADRDLLFQVDPSATAAQQPAIYPQSVASGDPRSNGIVLWTRVDPTQQASPSGDRLAWQIGTDPGFAPATILMEGVAVLASDKDGTVKIPVANSVLGAFTQYHYRFIYNQVPSRTGRFKTLPLQTDSLALLKLGYVVCQDYGNGYYNALTYLANEPVDFIVHLGDYIYETIHSGSFQNNPVRTVPPFPSGGHVPQNVDDYRHLYKVYRSTKVSRQSTRTSPTSCSGTITNSQTIVISSFILTTTLHPSQPPRPSRHFVSPPTRHGASTDLPTRPSTPARAGRTPSRSTAPFPLAHSPSS